MICTCKTDCGAPTPQNNPERKGPSRAGEGSIIGCRYQRICSFQCCSNSASGGGNSTPNSERSGIMNNLTSGNSNVADGNMGLTGSLENQRST
ncbi:hypothetical protein EVAR_73459_1 [Eumeta japonica]|uniref:Uncharacterized protein n=1 Tax=Eumeta variegata TaxID=151549 RepID=A0A4C1TGD2_EUMVA|nr:hypothetical protein EVAR_73459_1 [Eumeta japonica]